MDVKEILYKLINDSATEAEKASFSKWARALSPEDYYQLLLEYEAIIVTENISKESNQILLERIHQQINKEEQEGNTHHQKRSISIKWMAAAAAILVLVTGGWFLWNYQPVEQKEMASQTSQNTSIIPGGNKATLTLADGSTLVLDSANNGAISKQGNVTVIKLQDGQLSYKKEGTLSKVEYNTIVTPKGGEYQLVLVDGSKVWLNAASSLKYPTAFEGNERKVELQGEGYFEIAHHPTKPFRVTVNDMDIAVLGTHFNINSYNGEPTVKTTLLEGKVSIQKMGNTAVLEPGQQAVTNFGNGNIKINNHVDIEEVIAWKNGTFVFNSTNIETILRQVARWYDVDVVYENKTNETFSGVIPRSENISKLLNILEATGKVDFKISGKQIIVKTKK